jgi:hypothetical protein
MGSCLAENSYKMAIQGVANERSERGARVGDGTATFFAVGASSQTRLVPGLGNTTTDKPAYPQ